MINQAFCGIWLALVAFVAYNRARRIREAGERTEARKWMIVSIIAGAFTVASLLALADALIGGQPSPSPAQPRRSWSATPQPTVIPIPGWEKFEGDGVELWLPESYEGGSPAENLDVIVEMIRTLGPDFEQAAQVIERNPSMFLLYVFDSEIGDSGFLTNVVVGTMSVPSSLTLDTVLDEMTKELPDLQRVIRQEIVSYEHYQAGRVVIESSILDVHTKQVNYVIKDGNTIWLVVYATGRDEFDQRLLTFEQSIRTFRVQPSQP
jgi:hypothetical protein